MSPDIPAAYDPVPPIAPGQAPRIDDLVWERAARRPDSVAVRDGGTALSYAELTARADRLAAQLQAAGVTAADVVALHLPRSAGFLTGLLAVLRAGAACLPLAPTDPPARVDAILDTVAPAALVTEPGADARPGPWTTVTTADVPGSAGPPGGGGTDLAFVMPTSGSTGRPKAVRITHANYTGQLPWILHNFGLGPDDVTLFRAPVSFVSMLRQVVWPLTAGAELVVVPPGGEVDVAGMAGLIDGHRVSWLTFISPALAHFLAHARLDGGSVRQVVSGGDRLPVGTAPAFFRAFPAARLHHTYGMTEAIVVSCALLTGPDADERSLGPVLPGSSAVIVGDDGGPAPVGTVGELHVGGVGLALGYVGADEARFGTLGGERMFATGDRARWRPDGTFELVGRSDDMVKIRGFRIELGEVDAALVGHPAVGRAVCRAVGDGDRVELHAFLVAVGGGRPGGAELRAYAAERLPAHMVPTRWVWLDALPLTPNGKIDRQALTTTAAAAAPEAGAASEAGTSPEAEAGAGDAAGGDVVAETVAAAWRATLPDPGAPDFTAGGGTSFVAVEFAMRLGDELDLDVPAALVLDHPTLAEVTAAVRALAD